MRNNKPFNIVIAGVGGQGIITLTRILAQAALTEGYDVKTSELHGLSQRGGSVETHLRFGKEISSPLVRQGGADLIISLEMNESFKACYYGSLEKETIFLINNFVIPVISDKKESFVGDPSEFKKFSKKVFFVPATKIVEEEFKKPVLAGVLLLGTAIFRNLLPLNQNSIIKAMGEIVPPKYLSLNKEAFLLAGKIPKELK